MAVADKRLLCVECGAEFVWTAGEQAFFADKQFKNEPRRCRACKHRRGARRVAPPPQGPQERAETEATCSACGRTTTVPFRPAPGRPIYCRDCFQQRRQRRA
jgi:CxxC-x17-CxxC domain-containing protein